ncbi:hypothetical protein ACFX2A_025098 [Malus domestica]
MTFFTYPIRKGYGSHIQLLWCGLIGACLYCLWTTRNKLCFDDIRPSITAIVRSINFQLLEIDSLNKGNMKNSVKELCILRSIGLSSRPAKSPHVIEVVWKPPFLHWVKENIDGATRGSLRLAGIGGIFRDHFGSCVGCFATSLGVTTSVEAGLHTIIPAVNLAWEKGWHSIWIECDSSLAVIFTSTSHNRVPLRLRQAHGFLQLDQNMDPFIGVAKLRPHQSKPIYPFLSRKLKIKPLVESQLPSSLRITISNSKTLLVFAFGDGKLIHAIHNMFLGVGLGLLCTVIKIFCFREEGVDNAKYIISKWKIENANYKQSRETRKKVYTC